MAQVRCGVSEELGRKFQNVLLIDGRVAFIRGGKPKFVQYGRRSVQFVRYRLYIPRKAKDIVLVDMRDMPGNLVKEESIFERLAEKIMPEDPHR